MSGPWSQSPTIMLADLLYSVFEWIGGVLTVAIQSSYVALTDTRNVRVVSMKDAPLAGGSPITTL